MDKGVWILLLLAAVLSLVFPLDVGVLSKVPLVAVGLAAVHVVLNGGKKVISDRRSIHYGFLALLGSQIVALLWNFPQSGDEWLRVSVLLGSYSLCWVLVVFGGMVESSKQISVACSLHCGVLVSIGLVMWRMDDYHKAQQQIGVVLLPLLCGILFGSTHDFRRRRGFGAVLTGVIGIVMWILGARSAVLGALVFGICYLIGPLVSRRAMVLNLYFLTFCLLSVGFVAWYSNPAEQGRWRDLDSELRSEGEQGVFTGRDVIWSAIIREMEGNWLLGKGVGVAGIEVGTLDGRRLSAHSMYLQVLYRSGLVGLVALLYLCFRLWKMLALTAGRGRGRLGFAIFSGILVQQHFEVQLLENQLFVGATMWMVIGYSLVESAGGDNVTVA